MSPNVLRLLSAINVTERGAARLRASLTDDHADIRRAAATGDAADVSALRATDAFVQRYQQVYEHMTHRLYPAIFRLQESGDRPPAARPLLLRMQDYGLLDAQVWTARAELRNRLVHEYPVEEADRAIALLAALAEGVGMLDDLDRAIEYIHSQNLLGSPS